MAWLGTFFFLAVPGYGTVSPEAGHPRGNKLLLFFTLVHHCQYNVGLGKEKDIISHG